MRIQIRLRIQLITLMRIRILIFILCGADQVADPSNQIDADPDPQHCRPYANFVFLHKLLSVLHKVQCTQLLEGLGTLTPRS